MYYKEKENNVCKMNFNCQKDSSWRTKKNHAAQPDPDYISR